MADENTTSATPPTVHELDPRITNARAEAHRSRKEGTVGPLSKLPDAVHALADYAEALERARNSEAAHPLYEVEPSEEFTDALEQLSVQLGNARQAVSFFASVVRSGESWSPQCDQMLALGYGREPHAAPATEQSNPTTDTAQAHPQAEGAPTT